MQAGWYLKSADAPVAHWWDGARYTEHTSPLTGYPFAVHPDPASAPAPAAPPTPAPAVPQVPAPPVASAPPISAPPVAAAPTPTSPYGVPTSPSGGPTSPHGAPQPAAGQPVGAPPVGAPPRTGMSKGLMWGLIAGGVVLLLIIGAIVAVVVTILSIRPEPAVLPPSATSAPVEPAEPDPADPSPSSPAASGEREIDEVTKAVYLEFVRSSAPSIAGESDESLLEAGLLVCEMFDAGDSLTTVNDVIVQSGVASDESFIFLAVTIGALCPEHTDSIG